LRNRLSAHLTDDGFFVVDNYRRIFLATYRWFPLHLHILGKGYGTLVGLFVDFVWKRRDPALRQTFELHWKRRRGVRKRRD
jgi:hypothetical protein